MIALRLHTLAAAVAGAASLLAGAAHAGGHPCASAADCGGSYRPASAAYALTPPGPAYANAGYAQGGYGQGAYAQQGAYPAGYVGYDQASRGPVRAAPGYVGYEHASVGPAYAQGAYVQGGGYAQGGYAYGGQAVGYGGYPAPVGPDCATVCVPAYQVVQVAAPVETVQLASDVYTGGVGVTEISGGGGGGFNGNFEVQGFGDVSTFVSANQQVWANATANAKASANAYANASNSVNIDISNTIKGGWGGKGGHKGGKGGCDTCGYTPPAPTGCDTCSSGTGGGVGMGGWGGGHKGGGAWGGMGGHKSSWGGGVGQGAGCNCGSSSGGSKMGGWGRKH